MVDEPKGEPETPTDSLKECPFPVKCCQNNKLMHLQVDDATGFLLFRFGNGAVIMSNIFLGVALITLAERSIGCDNDDEVCDGKVYGFKPSSLIPLIATITGILSAFLLPIIGAFVDYTKYRKPLLATFAATLIAIQAIQIFTFVSTWFPMAILQAINGFMYQGLTLCSYAYLPEIRRALGSETMTIYSSRFYSWLFATEIVYLVIVTLVSITLLGSNDQYTAHFGQGLDVLISGFSYMMAVYFFTPKEPRRELPEGTSFLLQGFKQVAKTAGGIIKYYPRTLPWFYIAVLFSEAAVNSFSTISVTFLTELGFKGSEVGIIFIIVLAGTIPGTLFASFLTKKLKSPILSMKICLLLFIAYNFPAFLLLTNKDNKVLAYPLSVGWGFFLGWFYPTELDMYSTLMPPGQEAELAGFYLYCTQVLTFLPPLVFTLMNESGISLGWGGVQLNIYLAAALLSYFILPSWDTCVQTFMTSSNKMTNNDEEQAVDN